MYTWLGNPVGAKYTRVSQYRRSSRICIRKEIGFWGGYADQSLNTAEAVEYVYSIVKMYKKFRRSPGLNTAEAVEYVYSGTISPEIAYGVSIPPKQ